MGGRGWPGWSRVKGGKWDKCNSIINKKIQKNEERLRNLWDNLKRYNILIIGFQKEKRKRKKLKNYLKK